MGRTFRENFTEHVGFKEVHKKYSQYFNHEPPGIGKLNHNGQYYLIIRTVKAKLRQYQMLKRTQRNRICHMLSIEM